MNVFYFYWSKLVTTERMLTKNILCKIIFFIDQRKIQHNVLHFIGVLCHTSVIGSNSFVIKTVHECTETFVSCFFQAYSSSYSWENTELCLHEMALLKCAKIML